MGDSASHANLEKRRSKRGKVAPADDGGEAADGDELGKAGSIGDAVADLAAVIAQGAAADVNETKQPRVRVCHSSLVGTAHMVTSLLLTNCYCTHACIFERHTWTPAEAECTLAAPQQPAARCS